jgi:serine protease
MLFVRRWLPLLVLAALAMTFSTAAYALPKESLARYAKLGFVPGEVLVKYKSTVSSPVKQNINAQLHARVIRENRLSGISVVKVPMGGDVKQLAAAYRKRAEVALAEPNYIRQASFVPDDPLFATRQWNLYNPTYKGINIEGAWDFTFGDPSVKVAVLDTGVAYEDYDENNDGNLDYLKAPDFSATHFAKGFDFVNSDNHPNDDNGHGTYVAGIIAATTNDGIGCAGIASDVTIMPVKILDWDGYGTVEAEINGIYYAVQFGAKVINMSLSSSFFSQAERNACSYAYTRGVTVIAAAGNDWYAGDYPYWIDYPAGYDESVIAVGASTSDNQRAWYSYFGPSLDDLYFGYLLGDKKGLDLLAPGGVTWEWQDTADGWIAVDGPDLNGDGLSDGVVQETIAGMFDTLDFEYLNDMGTSAAAPHVSGVAALLVSLGVTNPAEVKDILERTATDLNTAGYDEETGWGLINAEAAVLEALTLHYSDGPTADAGTPQTLTDSDNNGYEAVVLDGSNSTWLTGFPIVKYEWKEAGSLLAEGVNPTVNIGLGVHTIALTCTDSVNRSDTATVMITVLDGRPMMRIQGVRVELVKRKGNKLKLNALVTITDAQGHPIKGVRVSGQWSGSITKGAKAGITNKLGTAKFSMSSVAPGTFVFTATGVTRDKVTYRPELNLMTSDFLTIY